LTWCAARSGKLPFAAGLACLTACAVQVSDAARDDEGEVGVSEQALSTSTAGTVIVRAGVVSTFTASNALQPLVSSPSTGRYIVQFVSLAGTVSQGTAQVTAMGSTTATRSNRCVLEYFGPGKSGRPVANEELDVLCTTAAGVLAATDFSAYFDKHNRLDPALTESGAHLFASSVSGATIGLDANRTWNSTSSAVGANACIRNPFYAKGVYICRLGGLTQLGGNATATAVYTGVTGSTTGNYCKVQGWFPYPLGSASPTDQQVDILCYDKNGGSVDVPFTLNFMPKGEFGFGAKGASAWIGQPSPTAKYKLMLDPKPENAAQTWYDGRGCETTLGKDLFTVEKTATGAYSVVIPWQWSLFAPVLTATGLSNTYCTISSYLLADICPAKMQTKVQVNCFTSAGSAADSTFAISNMGPTLGAGCTPDPC
jgi:hypothetical protein